MASKKDLFETSFDSLDAMMLAYADEAVLVARRDGESLDFTSESIAALDRCLAAIATPSASPPSSMDLRQSSMNPRPDPARDLEYDSRIWGAYFGEVVRRRYGGEWRMSPYPGGELAVPSLEVGGSHLYPMMKVFRRLTLGPAENLSDFYGMVSKRLGPPSLNQ